MKKTIKRVCALAAAACLAAAFCLPAFAQDTPPAVSCGAYVVMDADTGQILIEQNPDQKMYPASTTKIMTLGLTAQKTGGNWDESVTVSEEAVSGEAQAIPCTETTMNVNGQDCEALSYTLTGDDGQTSTVSYCLVGDDLKYVVTDAAEGRTIVEYRVTSTSVDQNLFIIPADYQIMTQEELAAQMGQ